MKRRWFIIAAATVLVVAAVAAGLVAVLRLYDARLFGAPHNVRRADGTTYTVTLREVAVGQLGADYVLLVFVRLSNPTEQPVQLERNRFELQTVGQQRLGVPQTVAAASLTLGPHAAADELLSYRLPAPALQGALWLALEDGSRLELKSRWARQPRLREGQFVSYRRRHW